MRMSERGREKDKKQDKPTGSRKEPSVRVPTIGGGRGGNAAKEREDSRLKRRMERDEEEAEGVLGEFEERLDLLEPESRARVIEHLLENVLPSLEETYCFDCGDDAHENETDCPHYEEGKDDEDEEEVPDGAPEEENP